MSERLPRPLRAAYEVVQATVAEGGENDLMLFSAAMAYSLVVSLAPLTIALSVLGANLAKYDVFLGSPLSAATAEQAVSASSRVAGAGSFGLVIVGLLVLYGASSLFVILVQALNRIWRQGSLTGARSFMRHHAFALLLLVVAGLGLFASAVLGIAIASLTEVLVVAGSRAGLDLAWLTELTGSRWILDFTFAAVVYTTAFATVPRIRPRLRDVVPGGLITAGAYALGQWGLAYYLSVSTRFSALGSFGAVLAFLVWAYYTAAIVLWGAELTYQLAKRRALARGGAHSEPYLQQSA